jgi:hypothetical protein
MRVRKCLSVFILLLPFLVASEGEASILSQQYTSSWVSPDFFPLGTTLFRIGAVENETGHDASFDLLRYLSDQTRQQLTTQGFREAASDNPNAVVIELRVHLYQEGSTFGRWLGGGAGAAYAVVYAAFRRGDQPVGAELLTVSVIGGGGLFSAGGEKTVLKDTANEIGKFLKGNGKE